MTWILLLCISAVFISIIIIYFYTYTKAKKLALELNHPKRLNAVLQTDISYTINKFDFKAYDGIALKGIDLVPRSEIKGTILVCHYLGGSKEMIIKFIEPLLKNGFRILSFDFRNHGESADDNKVDFALEKDFNVFYDQVKSMGIEGPFGIIGFSMGATPVLFALNRFTDIKAAVIDSGPLILVKEYFLYVLRDRRIKNPLFKVLFLHIYLHTAGFTEMSAKLYKILPALKGIPILMIHGELDNIIPLRNSEIVCEHINSDSVVLWKIPKSRHLTNYSLRKSEYEKRVLQFFIKNLAAGGLENEKDSANIAER